MIPYRNYTSAEILSFKTKKLDDKTLAELSLYLENPDKTNSSYLQTLFNMMYFQLIVKSKLNVNMVSSNLKHGEQERLEHITHRLTRHFIKRKLNKMKEALPFEFKEGSVLLDPHHHLNSIYVKDYPELLNLLPDFNAIYFELRTKTKNNKHEQELCEQENLLTDTQFLGAFPSNYKSAKDELRLHPTVGFPRGPQNFYKPGPISNYASAYGCCNSCDYCGTEMQDDPKDLDEYLELAFSQKSQIIRIHIGETLVPSQGKENVKQLFLKLEQKRQEGKLKNQLIRLGHGTHMDFQSMADCAHYRYQVETCLSSNKETGIISKRKEYPLAPMLLLGVPVTVGTDGGDMYFTDLKREYTHAEKNIKSFLNQVRAGTADPIQLPNGDKLSYRLVKKLFVDVPEAQSWEDNKIISFADLKKIESFCHQKINMQKLVDNMNQFKQKLFPASLKKSALVEQMSPQPEPVKEYTKTSNVTPPSEPIRDITMTTNLTVPPIKNMIASAPINIEEQTKAIASRRLACMLGNVLGDALGAPFEFKPVSTPAKAKERAQTHLPMQPFSEGGGFGGHIGQWTDDASMSLCLAEALMEARRKGETEFPKNRLMDLFYDWWTEGHNNGRGLKHSVGLGGIISFSINNWKQFRKDNRVVKTPFFAAQQAQYVIPKTNPGNGNGSIMRSGPAAAFARSTDEAMRYAYEQSVVTTHGPQSANCSRLLAYLSYLAITSKESTPQLRKEEVLSPKNFQAFVSAVMGSDKAQKVFTATSDYTKAEVFDLDSSMLKLCSSQKDDSEPHLNWRVSCEQYTLNPKNRDPGYYGSYVMDGLSLALHILHNTQSFEEALQMAAYMQGDADSVAAILGQLAGAIYGVENIPLDWLKDVNQHPLNKGSDKKLLDFLIDDCLEHCEVSKELCANFKTTLAPPTAQPEQVKEDKTIPDAVIPVTPLTLKPGKKIALEEPRPAQVKEVSAELKAGPDVSVTNPTGNLLVLYSDKNKVQEEPSSSIATLARPIVPPNLGGQISQKAWAEFKAKLVLLDSKAKGLKDKGHIKAAQDLEKIYSRLKNAGEALEQGLMKKTVFCQEWEDVFKFALTSELKHHRDFLSKCLEPLVRFINYLSGASFFETKSIKMLRAFNNQIDKDFHNASSPGTSS